MSISACSSYDQPYDDNATTGASYDIPNACYSDKILVQADSVTKNAGLGLLIVGLFICFPLLLMQCKCDEETCVGGTDFGGGGFGGGDGGGGGC